MSKSTLLLAPLLIECVVVRERWGDGNAEVTVQVMREI